MPRDEIDRDPDAELRTRRSLDKIRLILNDLIRRGDIARDQDGRWNVARSGSSSSSAPVFIGEDGGGDDFLLIPGPKGDTGATGPSGPAGGAGSGTSGMWVPDDPLFDEWVAPTNPPLNFTNDAGQFLNGTGQFATPGSSSGADLFVAATADETVTNSTTFTSHTQLQHSVTSGSVWDYVLWFLYSGNNVNTDIKVNWNVSAGTFDQVFQFACHRSATDTFSVGTSRTVAAANMGTVHVFGTDATDELRIGRFEFLTKYSADATAAFQFANNAASGVGTSCTVKAGSTLRGVRLV